MSALLIAPGHHFVLVGDTGHDTDCWLWLGYIAPNGYPRTSAPAGKTSYAHRVAYVQTRGPIPRRRELDHLCRVRRCVNPTHLEAVTHRENMRRGFRARGRRLRPSAADLLRARAVTTLLEAHR